MTNKISENNDEITDSVLGDAGESVLKQKMKKVKKRTAFIKDMRVIIPSLIVGVVLVNIVWVIVQSVINSMSTPDAKTDEIRMTNPRFIGQTGTKEKYVISGLEAIRNNKEASVVLLKSPQIDLKGGSKNPISLRSDQGRFDEERNVFELKGHVLIKGGSSDFSFSTEEATIDLNRSEIYGIKPVEAKNGLSYIKGQTFLISDNGNKINITGRDDLKIEAKYNDDTQTQLTEQRR